MRDSSCVFSSFDEAFEHGDVTLFAKGQKEWNDFCVYLMKLGYSQPDPFEPETWVRDEDRSFLRVYMD